jgi:hypothetical protein
MGEPRVQRREPAREPARTSAVDLDVPEFMPRR